MWEGGFLFIWGHDQALTTPIYGHAKLEFVRSLCKVAWPTIFTKSILIRCLQENGKAEAFEYRQLYIAMVTLMN